MSTTVAPYIVVVGIDYSETGALALRQALMIAADYEGAEVHLVNVVRNYGEFVEVEGAYPSPYRLSLAEAQTSIKEYAEQRVRIFSEETGKKIGRVVTHVRLEFAAEEIAQLAADLEADLVVVGTHGRRGLRRLMLGSVAEGVVRLAPCPVLVTRPKNVEENVPKIEPPCPKCVEARAASKGEQLWCEQHAERHGQRHTYHYESRVGAETNFPLVRRMY